jgi:energy-coupling factor transporter ATP-binding protein EcfA2
MLAAREYEAARAAFAARAEADRFNFPSVPPIWLVVWAALDWPWWPASVLAEAEARLGEADVWGVMRALRKGAGLKAPVRQLWVSGANGSGKTELLSFMANAMMAASPGKLVYCMATSEEASVKNRMQAKLHKYIPPEWKGVGKTAAGYVSYKEQTGFGSNRYTFPNGSILNFRFYGQNPATAGEGFDADAIFPDESIPYAWHSRLGPRVGRRNGFVMLANTPQSGYTEVADEFMRDLSVTRWTPGFMLPLDGKGADVAGALGLSQEEWADVVLCEEARPQLQPFAPQCRPEDCLAWCHGAQEPWAVARRALSLPPPVEVGGRVFEAAPRVGVSKGGERAVVFFNCADNPYGYPKNLLRDMGRSPRDIVKCRVYGVVFPSHRAIFSKFGERHIFEPEELPQKGTDCFVMDPASHRNPFMLWGRATQDGKFWVYREFPGDYALPDAGFPGPWAEPGGGAGGEPGEGVAGDAQESFGWGYSKIKQAVAWLEGWEDFAAWAQGEGAAPGEFPRQEDGRAKWAPEDAAAAWREAEQVRRWIDPRGGHCKTVSESGVSTPHNSLNDIGLFVEPASGRHITAGADAIKDALDRGDLRISKRCRNLVWAMRNWKNLSREGASKDPVDCLRYFFTSGAGWSGDTNSGRPGENGATRRSADCATHGGRFAAEPDWFGGHDLSQDRDSWEDGRGRMI